MPKKPFCGNQSYAVGDANRAYPTSPTDPEARLFCDAHLNEGRCFPCPYGREEIYQDEGRLRIAHRDPEGKLVGRCEDFESFEPIELSVRNEEGINVAEATRRCGQALDFQLTTSHNTHKPNLGVTLLKKKGSAYPSPAYFLRVDFDSAPSQPRKDFRDFRARRFELYSIGDYLITPQETEAVKQQFQD